MPGKKLEHQGIKVQLLGQIELVSARGHFHDFVSLGVPLGFLNKRQTFRIVTQHNHACSAGLGIPGGADCPGELPL